MPPPLPAVSRIARADLSFATGASDCATRPAGASDLTARLIGQWLSERFGRQFVIDNRPGGGGNVGTEAVVRAPADGYTVPGKTVLESIAYAKTSQAKSIMRRLEPETAAHPTGELFKMMAGVDMVHVPHRDGGPAFNDVLAGQVQVMFPTTVSSIGYIWASRLRTLAVTAATRSEVLPGIPTVPCAFLSAGRVWCRCQQDSDTT